MELSIKARFIFCASFFDFFPFFSLSALLSSVNGRFIIGKKWAEYLLLLPTFFQGHPCQLSAFHFRHAEFFIFSCNFYGFRRCPSCPCPLLQWWRPWSSDFFLFNTRARSSVAPLMSSAFCSAVALTCDFDVDVGHGKPPVWERFKYFFHYTMTGGSFIWHTRGLPVKLKKGYIKYLQPMHKKAPCRCILWKGEVMIDFMMW